MGTQFIQCYGKSDADAQNFISRLSGTYSSAERLAINTFFVNLKANGLYNLFDVLHLLCLDNSNDARLNLLGNTLGITSLSGFVARVGISPTTSGAAVSGYIPATHAVRMTQTSNHIGVYLSRHSAVRNTNLVDASTGGGNRFYLESRTINENREVTNLNNSDSLIAGLASADYPGTHINTRNNNNMSAIAGSVVHTVSRAPQCPIANLTNPLQTNVLSSNRVTALFAGGSITGAQSQQLENEFKALFTALGVPYV